MNSEVTFWVLLFADFLLFGFMFFGFILCVKAEKERKEMLSERVGYMEYLENLKKNEL